MNMNELEGRWDEVKRQVKEKWNKFTNDDIRVIHGKKDQLVKKLREHYGYTVEQADEEIGAFMKGCSCDSQTQKKIKNQPQV